MKITRHSVNGTRKNSTRVMLCETFAWMSLQLPLRVLRESLAQSVAESEVVTSVQGSAHYRCVQVTIEGLALGRIISVVVPATEAEINTYIAVSSAGTLSVTARCSVGLPKLTRTRGRMLRPLSVGTRYVTRIKILRAALVVTKTTLVCLLNRVDMGVKFTKSVTMTIPPRIGVNAD